MLFDDDLEADKDDPDSFPHMVKEVYAKWNPPLCPMKLDREGF